jgi:hypothetical protein
MNRLIWCLPGFFHGLILLVTSYRMVEVRNDHGVVLGYYWTRAWRGAAGLVDKRTRKVRKDEGEGVAVPEVHS